MNKEVISTRQAVCILAAFICGSSIVLGGCTDAEQDSWISLLVSQVIVIPMVLIYARIIKNYPEKNIYQISEILFGKIFGKIITILVTWYAIHLAALVLRNFSEFVVVVSMPETPQLPLMMIMLLVVVYLVKSGVGTLGKWSIIIIPIICVVVVSTTLLLLNQVKVNNLAPFLDHGTKIILTCAYKYFSFPFAETVLFLSIADCIKKENGPSKIYVCGILFGALILLLAVVRNILVLGPELMKSEYFPSYVAARIINVGDFLVRIEGSITANFILAGVTKVALCLFAASKGMASLFNIQDYKKLIIPVSLLSLALGCIIFKSTMEMVNGLDIYAVYAIPFQIIIPLIIWIGSEIKTRTGGQSGNENMAK